MNVILTVFRAVFFYVYISLAVFSSSTSDLFCLPLSQFLIFMVQIIAPKKPWMTSYATSLFCGSLIKSFYCSASPVHPLAGVAIARNAFTCYLCFVDVHLICYKYQSD